MGQNFAPLWNIKRCVKFDAAYKGVVAKNDTTLFDVGFQKTLLYIDLKRQKIWVKSTYQVVIIIAWLKRQPFGGFKKIHYPIRSKKYSFDKIDGASMGDQNAIPYSK